MANVCINAQQSKDMDVICIDTADNKNTLTLNENMTPKNCKDFVTTNKTSTMATLMATSVVTVQSFTNRIKGTIKNETIEK